MAPEPEEKLDSATEALRKFAIESKLFISIIHASEFFEHNLTLLERLDARIARSVKHLAQIKAMKQMLR